MNPDAFWSILIASMAGGFGGMLVMWSRQRSQIAGANKPRQWTVVTLGTAASVCALVAFSIAFREAPSIYAAMVVIVLTEWAAVLQSAVQLPVPRSVLRVRPGEFAFLGVPWTGVSWFGAFLRNTPLRHLGGRVFLSNAGGDPELVLRGIYDAERVHLWALLVSGPWLVFWVLQARWMSILCALAVHVPLNVYPVLHLRYVAGRIDRYLAKARRGKRDHPASEPTEQTHGPEHQAHGVTNTSP